MSDVGFRRVKVHAAWNSARCASVCVRPLVQPEFKHTNPVFQRFLVFELAVWERGGLKDMISLHRSDLTATVSEGHHAKWTRVFILLAACSFACDQHITCILRCSNTSDIHTPGYRVQVMWAIATFRGAFDAGFVRAGTPHSHLQPILLTCATVTALFTHII
eukprot:12391-Rhodomonas_salina.5